MGKQSINEIISTVMENDSTIEKCLVEDYEKLNKKCEDIINKIRYRKIKKINHG